MCNGSVAEKEHDVLGKSGVQIDYAAQSIVSCLFFTLIGGDLPQELHAAV